jgi:peptidoglycan-associated lipoprotein
MRKKLYSVTLVVSLLILGCAKKTVDNLEVKGTKGISATSHNRGANSTIHNGYENVDMYGQNRNIRYNEDDSYGAITSGIKKIYFGVDKYLITPDKLPIIINNAKILNRAIKEGAKVKIEGHCDATGTDEYNYALGLRRAKATEDALIAQGINPSAITIVSMGESSPECTTDYSSACFAKNRRVEFKIIR